MKTLSSEASGLIGRERERQTDRGRDTKRDRQTETDRDRQTDRQTEIEKQRDQWL